MDAKYAPFSVLLTYEFEEVEMESRSGRKVKRSIRVPRIQVFESVNEALRQHAKAYLESPKGRGGILEIEPPIADGFDISGFLGSITDES
jgi:hypothetical protein